MKKRRQKLFDPLHVYLTTWPLRFLSSITVPRRKIVTFASIDTTSLTKTFIEGLLFHFYRWWLKIRKLDNIKLHISSNKVWLLLFHYFKYFEKFLHKIAFDNNSEIFSKTMHVFLFDVAFEKLSIRKKNKQLILLHFYIITWILLYFYMIQVLCRTLKTLRTLIFL